MEIVHGKLTGSFSMKMIKPVEAAIFLQTISMKNSGIKI